MKTTRIDEKALSNCKRYPFGTSICMPFFCFSFNCYLDLFVSAVNCGQDKEGRLEISAEKDLVELFFQSVPKNTKEKAMRAFCLYEGWALWRKDVYNPRKETFIVGDILLV